MILYLVNAGMKTNLVDPSDYGTMEFALVIAKSRGHARSLFIGWSSEWLEFTSRLQILKVCEINEPAGVYSGDTPLYSHVGIQTWGKLKDVSECTPRLSYSGIIL